jgi:hypothetical protein
MKSIRPIEVGVAVASAFAGMVLFKLLGIDLARLMRTSDGAVLASLVLITAVLVLIAWARQKGRPTH